MMCIESVFNNFVGYFFMLWSSFRTDDEEPEISVRWVVLFAIVCRNVLDATVLFGGKAVEGGAGGRYDFWTLNDQVSLRNGQNRGAFQ